MKNHLKKLVFVLLLVCLNCKKADTISVKNSSYLALEIDSLIERKSFFEARRKFDRNKARIPKMDSVHIAARLNSIFNKLQVSNDLADRLLSENKNKITDSLRRELLGLKYVNHAKLHEYQKAYQIGKRLLENYGDFLDADEREGYRNANAIWQPLQDVAPQTILKRESTEFKMNRDKANLRNLPVSSNGESLDFIFDTGANISTVVESTVETMGMRRIPASIQVRSITGENVEASLAIADLLHMGNMTFTNVVFLVFPDNALYIPSIDFQIRGILGYPVIEAMKQITITKADEFMVPLQTDKKPESNMALDFLTPIVELEDENGAELSYAFDTGATTSMLYPAYFEQYRQIIETEYEPSEFEFGGAGGTITKKGYHVSFRPKVNHRLIVMDSVELIAVDTTKAFQKLYGNLGQDLISKFDAMTLNFESMYITFE